MPMLVTAVAVFVGMIAGGLLPPAPHRFARPRVQWPALLVAGVLLLAIGTRVDGTGGLRMVLAGYGALIVGALANAQIVGIGVLLVGLSANALVIAINSGMPVRPDALVAAGVVDRGEQITLSGHRHAEDGGSLLRILDDRIPLPAGGQVVSFGDLVLAVGLADATAHIPRRRRRDLLTGAADDAVAEDPAEAIGFADVWAPQPGAADARPRRPAHLAPTDDVVVIDDADAPARQPAHLVGAR
jgi:hypothetical protein